MPAASADARDTTPATPLLRAEPASAMLRRYAAALAIEALLLLLTP
jgi:hypothetical protein